MAAIDSYSKRLSPPGSLIGISTIHFVKWLVIDDGRRLMMVSDYDGSWESYIDEFAEMILSGLDAIWDTVVRLSARRRARPAGVQAVPAQPPGAVRGVLQCVPRPDRAEHRQRPGARARQHRRPLDSRAQPAGAAVMTDARRPGCLTTCSAISRASSPAATATCRMPPTCSSSFRMPAQAGAGCDRVAPAITSVEPMADAAERREAQAGDRR